MMQSNEILLQYFQLSSQTGCYTKILVNILPTLSFLTRKKPNISCKYTYVSRTCTCAHAVCVCVMQNGDSLQIILWNVQQMNSLKRYFVLLNLDYKNVFIVKQKRT